MRVKKKVKGYIKDNRPAKLRSYLASHEIDVSDVKLGHGQNLLHYCAKHGSPEMLRSLLRLHCDATVQDKNGNLPLHTALERGLKAADIQTREILTEMVNPLLDAYPMGQDMENRDGTTAHDLLKVLKRKVKNHSSHTSQEKRDKDRVTEEEEEMWRQKLTEEAAFEYEEQMPRYSHSDDYHQEKTGKSFDDWSEMIRQEYIAKQQRRNHHTFWRDRKRKNIKDTDRDRGDNSKKARREESQEEKLHKAREEMKKCYKADADENKILQLLSKKKRYENKFTHLLSSLSGKTLTFACIPWPSVDLSSVAQILFCDLPDRKNEAFRKYLRAQQVRWHPDKFTQKFGDHLHPEHRPKIMIRVKAISQILNHISNIEKNNDK